MSSHGSECDTGGVPVRPLATVDDSPYRHFTVHCPGCGTELARLDTSEAADFSAYCGTCEEPHTELTAVAVPMQSGTTDLQAVGIAEYRTVIDEYWSDRVREDALDLDDDAARERANVAAHFWNEMSHSLGWNWTPPVELALGDVSAYYPDSDSDSDSHDDGGNGDSG